MKKPMTDKQFLREMDKRLVEATNAGKPTVDFTLTEALRLTQMLSKSRSLSAEQRARLASMATQYQEALNTLQKALNGSVNQSQALQ